MKIIENNLSGEMVAALLSEHLEGMARTSPPENVHALPIDALRSADVTFWAAWDDGQLVGCGALKELDQRHGEIKSMRTAEAHVGRGVASAILSHLINESRARQYARLSLETGSGAPFESALSLYKKFGFEYCGPFSNYEADAFSRFMTLEL